MADKSHQLTDEKLEEMEKRLSAIYSRAEKEIQQHHRPMAEGLYSAIIKIMRWYYEN